MPVTSKSKLYRAFPASFADDVTHHVEKRTEVYKAHADIALNTTKDGDKVCFVPISRPRSRVSSRPIMSPLSERSEEGPSPRSEDPSPRVALLRPSPCPGLVQTSNTVCTCGKSPASARRSPRCTCQEHGACARRPGSSRRAGSRLAKSTSFVQSPRVARLPSQPTSVSLDDVDLWESDSEQNDNEAGREENGKEENSLPLLDAEIQSVLDGASQKDQKVRKSVGLLRSLREHHNKDHKSQTLSSDSSGGKQDTKKKKVPTATLR